LVPTKEEAVAKAKQKIDRILKELLTEEGKTTVIKPDAL
jgi:hypothetical protein